MFHELYQDFKNEVTKLSLFHLGPNLGPACHVCSTNTLSTDYPYEIVRGIYFPRKSFLLPPPLSGAIFFPKGAKSEMGGEILGKQVENRISLHYT